MTIGDCYTYTFNVTDDQDTSLSVRVDGGFATYELDPIPNSDDYTYTVCLMNVTELSSLSALVFTVNDSLSAVGMLSPELVIYACLNGGNATREGVSAMENVIILNCICPGGMSHIT